MAKKETHPNQAADLRREAEKIACEREVRSPENLLAIANGNHGDTLPQGVPMIPPQGVSMIQTLHELRVHQIELEMQNTALQQRQEELDVARARYFDLYELAPVGYITVSQKGLILESNLTAATMLGVARGVPGLAHPVFSQFIHTEDQDICYLFSKQLLETCKPQVCELRMVKKDGPAFWAHLEATVAQDHSAGSLRQGSGQTEQVDKPVIRVVISDISAEQKLKETRFLLEQMMEERAKQQRQETVVSPVEDADTILLVDDEPLVLTALTRTLRDSPYQVLTAGNGSQALEIMETTKIKVIVSDEKMEGMRGMELLAEVKRRSPHTLCILLTGHASLEVAMRAVNEGTLYRLLTKPWDDALLSLALFAATEKYNLEAQSRRLQEALRQSEMRLRAITDFAQDTIIMMDQGGLITYWNPAAGRLFGYTYAEAMGQNLHQLIMPQRYRAAHNAAFARFQLTGHGDAIGTTLELEACHKKGHGIPVELSLSALFLNGVWGSAGIIRDITDRKQAEKALAERTAQLQEVSTQLQLAVSVAEVGIWEWDIVTNRLTWDAPMYSLYGVAPDKFSGAYEAWAAGLHPDDLEEARKNLQRAILGEGEGKSEFRVVWPDGSIHWIRANSRIQRDREGRALRMTGTNLEITRDKLAVQAADAANRAKGTFLANMSHEIRTPMSGVLGMTGLLLDTPLTSQQRNYAEKIRISGVSLLAVINDILDISKIEAGKIAVESIPFSVQAVIGNVVNSFESQAEGKKIELYSIIDPELPATLLGDPQRLTQVISNLVGNAVKFTKAGFIRLEAKVQRRMAMDVELEIGVEDTGIGITEEELSRLFKSFSQADASMTRIFGGSGLGLVISRNLVELMGGTLQVESVSGKGSLFTIHISFPVTSELLGKDLKSAPINYGQIRFTGVRALVVEDRAINREILVELLRNFGVEATDIAGNGREAVAMVRDNDYDIAFMDIQMPVMDGITATRKIRDLDKTGVDRLPIIAMTAHALTGDRQKSLDAGMNDHLNKPIDPETLGAALRQWLPPEKCEVVAAGEPGLVANPNLLFIPQISGLDLEDWQARMGDNQELYLKLLRDFVADHRDTPEQLLQALRADRREDLLQRVHAIRGVAGNLGGKALEAAAGELENACRAAGNAGNGVPFALGEPLRLLIECLEAQTLAISAVLVQHPVITQVIPEGPQVYVAELRELLEQLQRFLKRKEPQPCNKILLTLLQTRLPEDQESVLAELSRLVQRYRLAEALVFLNKNISHFIEKKEKKEDE